MDDELAILPPPLHKRCTLGCRRRKQALSPCVELSPSLVLNQEAHNRSRQWAILNYSSTENVSAEAGLFCQWSEKQNKKMWIIRKMLIRSSSPKHKSALKQLLNFYGPWYIDSKLSFVSIKKMSYVCHATPNCC